MVTYLTLWPNKSKNQPFCHRSLLPKVLIGERIKVFQLSMNLGVPGVRLFVTQTAGELFITEAAECQTTKKMRFYHACYQFESWCHHLSWHVTDYLDVSWIIGNVTLVCWSNCWSLLQHVHVGLKSAKTNRKLQMSVPSKNQSSIYPASW